MSVIPEIYDALAIQEQRSRNRRANTTKYKWGKKLPTVHFIITRSDLLAATKEQVDSKMEYVRNVLSMALGKARDSIRLGNVHMISAKRGWWTKEVKEEIRRHGGGVWVVGKANAGKSSFIEACFPKDSQNLEKIAELVRRREQEGNMDSSPPSRPAAATAEEAEEVDAEAEEEEEAPFLDPEGLLPPAPQEELYPVLPTISSISGTTVSPIRIPFGRGKGEIIDLPGLPRPSLENYVRDNRKKYLIMTRRLKPKNHNIKHGQSLVLEGGLVRVRLVGPEDAVLSAACFLPFTDGHVTSNIKSIQMEKGWKKYPKGSMAKQGIGEVIASAGVFDLKWNVTHSNLPTRLAKAIEDHGIKPPPLPYKVMSADLLVEGCGWIELRVQVRTKSSSSSAPDSFPQVEVYTPHGQFIGIRPPLESFNLIIQKRHADKRKHGHRGRQNIGHLKRTLHMSK